MGCNACEWNGGPVSQPGVPWVGQNASTLTRGRCIVGQKPHKTSTQASGMEQSCTR